MEKIYDPQSVPVEFILGSDAVGVKAALSCLSSAAAVAVDTETVYDGNDNLTTILPDGTELIYKRNMEVDGPGSWRVTSIAARFGSVEEASYKCWVIDMDGADFAALDSALSGVRPYGWNANFDRLVLSRDGVNVHQWWDAMLIDAVVRSGMNGSDSSRYSSLAASAYRELGLRLDGKETTRLSYDAHTPLTEEQIRYAGADAVVTLWVGDLLGSRAREHGLADTVVLECQAQPLIQQMTFAGLPIDKEGYIDQVLDPSRVAASDAAERLAIATTGGVLLDTIAAWSASKSGVKPEDPEAEGLAVLRDPERFTMFISDVAAQQQRSRADVAALLGGKVIAEDLFSESSEPTVVAPFVLDDENEFRRWVSKTYPAFAAAMVAVTLDSALSVNAALEMAASDPDAVFAAAAGKKRLVKAHDLDAMVLPAMAGAPAGLIPDDTRKAMARLSDYRRYSRILEGYGAASAPVRLIPDWKPTAAESVKEILNEYSTEQVKAFTTLSGGKPRLLGKSDSVDHDSLVLIGGPIADAILEHRKHEKVLTTYGDDFLKYVHPITGRIHARYSQAMTGTGRLSSSNPNAQNLPPVAKKFLRPIAAPGCPVRVLVAGDLSQAELRYVADQSGDEQMLAAFANGEDLHTRTASLMFNLDIVALKKFGSTPFGDVPKGTVEGLAAFFEKFSAGANPKVDPTRSCESVCKELRQKAKSVAFGYAYGLKGASLAQQLTVSGVVTTKEEADELLALFDVAYPAVARWMGQRVSEVAAISQAILNDNDLDVDFEASWRLHGSHSKVKSALSAAKASLGYTPDNDELSHFLVSDEVLATRLREGEDMEAARARATEHAKWVSGFEYPVVLRKDGSIWRFSSRTAGGRVRWFPVLTSDWEWGMVGSIVRHRDPKVRAARDEWVLEHNAAAAEAEAKERLAGRLPKAATPVSVLDPSGRPLFGKALEKQFENRPRRAELVAFVFARVPTAASGIMRAGMADRVRFMTNQYRNHPVQGGVADAMLSAMAALDVELRSKYPTARAIQSVHDSLVVECDAKDAIAIRSLMVSIMEAGLNRFCPTVVAKADADIQLSLDADSALSDEQVLALAA